MLYSRYRIASGLRFYFRCLISILTLEFLHQRRVPRLEEKLRRFTREENLLAIPQARVGLYWYLREVLEPGDEVLTSSYTLIDMVNMILCAGGKPVFVDTAPKHYHLCLEDLKKKITPKTKVVVVPHLYGTGAPIEAIVEICRERGVLVFEDCAQAVGASHNGKMLGTYGDAGVYSFGALKNVNGIFGGALVTKDARVLNAIRETSIACPLMSTGRLFSKLFFCFSYDILTHPWFYTPFASKIIDLLDESGHVDKDAVRRTEVPPEYLCQMTSMQASLILDGLKTWKQQAEASREIADSYTQALINQTNAIHIPPLPGGGYPTNLQFPVWVEESNLSPKRYLRQQSIDINVDFFRDVSSLDCFSEYVQECPNTHALLGHLALLPTYPRQDKPYTELVIRSLEAFRIDP